MNADHPQNRLPPAGGPDELNLVGARIGEYEVRRVISSGGMGTVFEAVQDRPRRTVAVKIVSPSVASPETLRRFEFEARVLASLRHPGIAHVFEVGRHPSASVANGIAEGLPYLVMEYIPQARTLIAYARAHELGLKPCLRLFIQVLDAVQHGHQKGIIHRDLKPANLLVDPQGNVKIIDFGLARAVNSGDCLTTQQTVVGQLLGTLPYMSPEQCHLASRHLDTRSDLYSLGVILYELLCEQLPYDVASLSIVEAARRIREDSPERPSTVQPHLGDMDVELILLKALEKDPARRYQSAGEFRADLTRFLEGKPISARPASALYHLKMFARRNSALVSGVVAACVVLAAAMVLNTALYLRAEAQREIAEQRYDEIVRLADLKRLSDLEAEAEALWPCTGQIVPALMDWIGRAEELIGRLEAHRSALETLRLSALPYGNEEARRTRTFDDPDQEWRHNLLTKLVDGLENLAREEGGTLSCVTHRIAFAAFVRERSLEDHAEDWAEAVASIANETESPRYQGLRIEPILGLVPLGPDPDSHLWEFAHLQSGTVPNRDANGHLEVTDDMGVVLVLLPGGTYNMGAILPSAEHPLGSPNVDPLADPDEGPVRAITLQPFLLSKYEMTHGQYLACARIDRETHEQRLRRLAGTERLPLHPVNCLSWYEGARLLSLLDLRLPSESEWEYGARAGTTTRRWMGDNDASLAIVGIFRDGLRGTEWPPIVGKYPANPFGINGAVEGVFEWVQDSDCSYDVAPTDGSAFVSRTSRFGVIRGGGNQADHVPRTTYRGGQPKSYTGGLRPARSLK